MKEATIESKVDALIRMKRRKSFKSRKIWGIPMVWVLSIVVASMMVSGALVYALWDQIGIDITGTFSLEGQTQQTILYDDMVLDNYAISLTDMDITEINCGEEFTFTHTLDATNNFDKDYAVTFDLTNMPINEDPNSEYYGFFFEVREHGTTNAITGFDLDKTTSVSFDYWYCLHPSYENITTFPFDLRIQLLEKITTGTLGGLISHFEFENGFGSMAFDTAGCNHLTLPTTNWTTGKVGNYAFQFDMNYAEEESVILGDFEYTDNFSVDFWANKTDDGEALHIGKYDGSTGWRCEYTNGHKIQLRLNSNKFITTDDTITPAEWHYICIAYDGTTQTGEIWVDGVEQAVTIIGTISTITNPATFKISGTGFVDELAVLDCLVDQDFVNHRYNSGSGTPTFP